MRLALVLAALPVLASAQVTYTREISRIMQTKCQICHRPNDIAPFPLTSYRHASAYAADIRRAVDERIMPPWKPGESSKPFAGSFALTEEERLQILTWVDSGAPEGDEADLPEPVPVSESPWHLGEPDLVLTAPKYTPPPEKPDTYRCFVMPSNLDADRMLSATQALPGDPTSVHHVLIYVDESGESVALDGADGQPGYDCFGGPNLKNLTIGSLLGGWVPGFRTQSLPDGIGLLMKRQSTVVMQVHYHPSGLEREDETRLGFWFRAIDGEYKRMINVPIVNTRFLIPPGESEWPVKASIFTLPGKIITIAPHMHLLGKSIKVVLDRFLGKDETLIEIDHWDFNWQGFYTFVEPVDMPAAAFLRVTAIYDNTENNPNNPNNPLKEVRWGEGTEDEMCLAFVGVILDNEALLGLLTGR